MAADIFLFPLIHFRVENWGCAMSRKKLILVNTVLLTISTLLLRVIGMVFQAWLASHLGAEGIGLYQLAGSVTVLFSVFAVSGIRFAATKLVSEETTSQIGNAAAVIRCCALYALFFGFISAALLWHSAGPLGFLWVGDARVVLSLRIASAAMPLIALSAVLNGYFTACGHIWKMVLVQFLVTLVGAGISIALLLHIDLCDLEKTCAIITVGSVISEILGFVFLLLFYLEESRHWRAKEEKTACLTKRMLSAALPLALSSYTRTALNTLEHMMIPKTLRLSGLSAEAALSGYGVVHGMALPAVLFPACLLFSLAEMIVPELTRSKTQRQTARISHIVRSCRAGTLIYASITAVLLFCFASEIAVHIFHNVDCAKNIRLLAPLIPIMNLDTVTDGCLRGLGQQSRVMTINILDAALGVALVLLLLPINGLKGYIQMIWITETVNCMLSSFSLIRALNIEKSSG